MSGKDREALAVALDVDEREWLNEWAAEIGVPTVELVPRLILRYLYALRSPEDRDAVDKRIGETLIARAGAMGHIPSDAADRLSAPDGLRAALRKLGLDDDGDPG